MFSCLCVTANPALDRTLSVPGLQLGSICRPAAVRVAAGGKGLNVTRVIRRLGGQASWAGLLGGHVGRQFLELAEQEGLAGVWTALEGETRTCTILVDSAIGEATGIYETGMAVPSEAWMRFQHNIISVVDRFTWVTVSGSLPASVRPRQFAELVRALSRTGKPVWVDTSGTGLDAALTARPVGIKINAAEAGAWLGARVNNESDALGAAAELRERSGSAISITLGAQGAVVLTDKGQWYAKPPNVRAANPIGSGDAFLAGWVAGLAAGFSIPDALQQAVAAGAANAQGEGGGQFDLEAFRTLRAATLVQAMPV